MIEIEVEPRSCRSLCHICKRASSGFSKPLGCFVPAPHHILDRIEPFNLSLFRVHWRHFQLSILIPSKDLVGPFRAAKAWEYHVNARCWHNTCVSIDSPIIASADDGVSRCREERFESGRVAGHIAATFERDLRCASFDLLLSDWNSGGEIPASIDVH